MSDPIFETPEIRKRSGEDRQSPLPSEFSPSLGDAAFHGLAGEIVKKVAPHTEADPAAMLVQLFVMFGNLVGRSPYFCVENTKHHANEFAVIVGRSARARKGTSFNRIAGLTAVADDSWFRNCVAHGVVSGEGIVHAVRDDEPGKNGEIVAGVHDKRLLIVEEEFGGALAASGRRDNTITAVLRSAWDGKDLRTLAKNCHSRATAPHISMIGHITFDELKNKLRGDSLSNGFANRILWVFSQRSQLLPLGGMLRDEHLKIEGERLAKAAEFARQSGEIIRDHDADALWIEHYPVLSAERPGIVGDVTSRMEAHAVRLSLIYALLDSSPIIQPIHLRAAFVLCDYALLSAQHCFGGLSANAKTILAALNDVRAEGLTRSEIANVIFQKHISSADLDVAFDELMRGGLARCKTEATKGAPRERWFSM